ncbi:hypothetical protein J2X97_000386 [Epilithonimonas hungarica]|uniref:hypothetical protein n=1 Tax=Epilithonimonas hungarica TaxID=454006 RepID=UPI00278AEB9A|nr:hypothetical protein [Epilithonimonas hungarica]MDP9954749.1 hypothetical protein [Epilithonimonas hungarica]
MNNYLGNFFKRAKAESWEDGVSFETIDLRDGFSGFIFFSEDHFIECQIKTDEVTVYDSFTDKNHEYMFDAFAEYVKKEIMDSESTYQDIEETNHSLLYN